MREDRGTRRRLDEHPAKRRARLEFVQVFACALAACHPSSATPSGGPSPCVDPSASAPTLPWVPEATYDELETPKRIAALETVVREARIVIASDAFRVRLQGMPDLFATPDADASLATGYVANEYLGLDGVQHQHPTHYALSRFLFWVSCCGSATATTETGVAAATTYLHACTLDRASCSPGGDRVPEFACAVNTIAHEWTHTIPDDAGATLFLDRGHDGVTGKKKLVSYTVGALAQCLYLDTHGYPVADVSRCVSNIGTSSFCAPTCTEAWARTLAPGAPPAPPPCGE